MNEKFEVKMIKVLNDHFVFQKSVFRETGDSVMFPNQKAEYCIF